MLLFNRLREFVGSDSDPVAPPQASAARPRYDRRVDTGGTMIARLKVLAMLAALLLAAHGLPAAAQGYPNRPVRIVVPFPAGGLADVLARAVSDELAKSL